MNLFTNLQWVCLKAIIHGLSGCYNYLPPFRVRNVSSAISGNLRQQPQKGLYCAYFENARQSWCKTFLLVSAHSHINGSSCTIDCNCYPSTYDIPPTVFNACHISLLHPNFPSFPLFPVWKCPSLPFFRHVYRFSQSFLSCLRSSFINQLSVPIEWPLGLLSKTMSAPNLRVFSAIRSSNLYFRVYRPKLQYSYIIETKTLLYPSTFLSRLPRSSPPSSRCPIYLVIAVKTSL